MKSTPELADSFVDTIRDNHDVIREKIIDDNFIEELYKNWYFNMMDELAKWLKARSSLSKAQIQALIKSFKKVVREFQLQGVFDTAQNDYRKIGHAC